MPFVGAARERTSGEGANGAFPEIAGHLLPGDYVFAFGCFPLTNSAPTGKNLTYKKLALLIRLTYQTLSQSEMTN